MSTGARRRDRGEPTPPSMVAPARSGVDERTPTTPLEGAVGASPPAVSPPASSVSAAGSAAAVAATASTTALTAESATGPPSVVSLLPLYTPADAAELLAVRESWLRRRATARTVPCTFLRKHLRFSHADIVMIATAGACSVGAPTPRFRRGARRAGRAGRR